MENFKMIKVKMNQSTYPYVFPREDLHEEVVQ